MSWINQFSLLGAELWFLVLAVDLHATCMNPFSSFKSRVRFYLVFVWGASAAAATMLVFLGPSHYGVSEYGIPWVKVA